MAQNIRNRRSNKCLQAALFAGVAAAPLLTVPAFAQEGDAADGLDTITVTAQRREENQQEVPISVSTLPEDRWRTFQTAGEDIRALAARIPGVYAESSNGRAAPRFYIRGLGNVDFDLAASQPVSIIVDEVVLENVLLKSTPIFDIEQVEVLRGPQGTLFGRNTPAGIIKFDTKKPTEEFDLYAQFAYGTLDTITGQFGVGGPIIEDLLSVRISGLAQTRGAYIDNAAPGFEQEDAFGDFEEFAGRAQVLVTPTDRLSVLLKGNIRTLEGTSALFRANIIEPGVGGLIENFDRETVFFDGGAGNRQEVDTWGVSGKIDIDFGAATLTSVTAFNSGTSNSRGDIDGGFVGPNSFFDTASPPAPPFGPDTIPFPSDTQDSIDDLDQFTQEVRIASTGDGPLSWQLGGFYFDSTVVITTQGPGFPPLTTIENANESWAVFGQVSYDLTDRLNLTGGVRYTEDERNFRAIAAAAATVNPTRVKDEDVSWDISALYKVNPEVNVYVRVADGFRGPTIQGRDVAFSPGSVDAQTTADSEDILSFEAGIKTALLNNRARINIAGYHYRVDNQQFSIIGGAGNLSQVINADRGVGYGFEADAEFLLLDNWFMSLGFSFNDTEIRDDQLATDPCGSGLCTVLDPLNGFGQALVDGNPFPNAPLTTFNAFTEYTIPLPFGGDLFVNTDWALQGETNFFLYEAEEFTVSGNFEGGARIGYRDTERGYEVAVFARNITNEENLRGAIDFNNLTGFINEPRVIGAQLTFSR